MANTDTTITIMAFEGGALMHALGAGAHAEALADKIADADSAALAASKVEFDISFDPIEVGMAFEAVSNSESVLSKSLAGKLQIALKAKLDELGVAYGDAPAQQTSDDSAAPTAPDSTDDGESDEDEQDAL